LTRSSSLGIAPPCHTRKVPKPRRLALCRGFPRRLALCRGLCSLLLHSLATTRAPHSPFATGPGHNAASAPLVLEVASFISVPTPQHKAPKRTPPSIRKPPSITTSPPASTNSHALIAPTPAALSPLQACKLAPTTHALPHSELSHTHSHPSPGRTQLACTPARASDLPRPAAATHLPRLVRHTHLAPLAKL
jgi:hypothetical protein